MKQIFSIVIIASLMLQTVRSAGILINYQLNKVYYAEVLCENKDKPELQCHGMCHVVEELEDAEEQAPVTPSVPEFEFKPITFGKADAFTFESKIIYEIALRSFYQPFEGQFFKPNLFRPPEV